MNLKQADRINNLIVYGILTLVLILGGIFLFGDSLFAQPSNLSVEWTDKCVAGWHKGLTNRFTITCGEEGEFKIVEGKEFIPGIMSAGHSRLVVKDMQCTVKGIGRSTILECRGLEAEEEVVLTEEE